MIVSLLCQIFEKMVFLANTNFVSMYWQVTVYCWDMVIPPLYYVFLINGLGFIANIYNIVLSHQFEELYSDGNNSNNEGDSENSINYFKSCASVLYAAYLCLNLISYYTNDQYRRVVYLAKHRLRVEEIEVDNHLAKLLPSFVTQYFSICTY